MKQAMSSLIATMLVAASGVCLAKLPPLSPEAQAKADEAKAKAAHADKVAAYQLCKAQNAVAESYAKANPGAKIAPTPCQDPGAFVPPPTAEAPAAAPAPAATAAAAPEKK